MDKEQRPGVLPGGGGGAARFVCMFVCACTTEGKAHRGSHARSSSDNQKVIKASFLNRPILPQLETFYVT